MKARVFFVLAAATVLLASCMKEKEMSNPSEFPAIQTQISVGIDNIDTKTYMGPLEGAKHKVYWSNGDKININGIESAALEGITTDTQKATFTFASAPSVPYNVLYPASDWTNATQITLPDTQIWKEGNFADGMVPMSGYSADGSNIAVKYLCAIVRVPVVRATSSADIDSVACVRFRGRNNEQVKGLFNINYSTGVLTAASNSAKDMEVRVYQKVSTETGAVYYVTVPAGTYSKGFDIILQDKNNDCMTQSRTVSTTLAAGNVYNLADITFIPDGTTPEADLVITSAEELVAFATAYNNKTYARTTVAKLGSNINFDPTTSEAFNSTGGIGLRKGINGSKDDFYYDGIFDGNGKTISGLVATVPLFSATGEGGSVKNLTIDNTCSFTYTHPKDTNSYFGAVVAYHKGVLDNVSVAADVTVAETSDVTKYLTLGGLVGRETIGDIRNSTYSGLITVPAGFASTAKLFIGGVVAYITNEAGRVTNSNFKGAISNAAAITSTDKTNPYTVIGGVLGYNNGGTVSSCNATADHEAVASAYSDFNGVIVSKSTIAYNSAFGGIVGENNKGTISSCENAATIAISIYKDGGADAKGRYIKSGGIVGKNNANGIVNNCTNKGSVQHRSNPRLQSLGGIAGWNAGSITACTNNAPVNHMTSGQSVKAGRVVGLGGVIGENVDGATVSDVHNTANIQISSMEDGTASDVRMGGVIGVNNAAIDGGSSKNITNSGQVYFSPNMANQFLGYEIGGIVGYSTASIQNVKNSGYVYFRWNSDANVASKVYLGGIVGLMGAEGSITGCVNEGGSSNAGEVFVNIKTGTSDEVKHTDNYAGGIVGKSTYKLTISDCTNSGYVHGGNSFKINGTTFYAGGIIAYLSSGASSISNCTNSGVVYNNHSSNSNGNNNTTYNGGIAGWVSGTSGNVVSITGCSHTTSNLGPRRGYSGGIVGYANYASLSNCSVGAVKLNGSAYFIGGIAGWMQNGSISNCSFAGTEIFSSQIQPNGGGGIAAKLDACVVDGCQSYVTDIYHVDGSSVKDANVDGGAIVGISGTDNTIKNCHYKPTINEAAANIAGTGEFTDGDGNVADL